VAAQPFSADSRAFSVDIINDEKKENEEENFNLFMEIFLF
jgi:hypothetical protein